MKYLIAGAVVLILFVLPAGSYYYLQKGYNYRVNALEALKPKKPFPDLQVYSGADVVPVRKVLDHHVSIILTEEKKDSSLHKQLEALIDQFGKRELFQVVRLGFREETEQQNKAGKYFRILDPGHENMEIQLGVFYLTDTISMIRNTYLPVDIKKLVEHTAIVIPLPKKKEIRITSD